jgi:hypothetical protein
MAKEPVHSLGYDRVLFDLATFYGSPFVRWFEDIGRALMVDYWREFPQEILTTPLDAFALRVWFDDTGRPAYERWADEQHGVRYATFGPLGSP